ncbi:hypothetical protein ACT17S_00315 [Glutamicibacter mysorens]
MIATIRDKALSVGGRIHPLLGPIFTGRPNATNVGDTCSLCVGDRGRPADTTLRDKHGQPAYVCLEHDLLLHKAISDLDQIMSDYETEVMAVVMAEAERPAWMPKPVYSKLQRRAQYWVHVFALQIFSDLMKDVFEQHCERIKHEIQHLKSGKD